MSRRIIVKRTMKNPSKTLCGGSLGRPVNPLSVFFKTLSTLPPATVTIVNNLISIFTKQPFCLESPELRSLAPMLNTLVVETALNGFKNWKRAHLFFIWASKQHGYTHNIYAYNTMASILSRARQIDSLRALSVDLLDQRCKMSPGALGFLIRCFGNAGMVEEANFLFDRVKNLGLCEPNVYSYNCLLEVVSKYGSVDLIEMRLNEISNRGLVFDKFTLTPALQAYCNAGKLSEALNVFNEMNGRGWIDGCVFSILALSFSKWGEVDKAFKLIERMEERGVLLNEKTFCTLIHGFVKLSRVDKALQLFDRMKKSSFAPDVSIYDVLIEGLCAKKQLEKALHLYSEMKEVGIQPDSRIISKLVSSFSETEELAFFLRENHEHLDSNTITLISNTILIPLVNNGSVSKAYHILCSLMGVLYGDKRKKDELSGDKKVLSPFFTIVIEGLLKVDKLDLALSLFRDMDQIGCKKELRLYNNLIDGLCSSDRLEESYELLKEMQESGFEPKQFTHNSIFGCLCRRMDVIGALDLIKKMRVHGHEPWIKHSTLLVKQLCKNGKVIDACDFLANMVQEGFLPDIVVYSACLDGLIEIQDMDRGLKLFRDFCAHGYCPDVIAYNILIKGFCRIENIAEAQNLLNEMMERDLVPSVVTYNLLVDGWCKIGCIDEAMLCLSRMSENEREPNVITYTSLINGLCSAGRPDDAVKMWNEMSAKGCTPSRVSFMAFIHGLCKCGRPNTALSYYQLMRNEKMEPDAYVYVALINALVDDLNLPLAFEMLKEMVAKGNFPHPHDKNYITVREVIRKLSEDSRTSASVNSLVTKGSIPGMDLFEFRGEGG